MGTVAQREQNSDSWPRWTSLLRKGRRTMKDWHDMRNDEFEKYLIEVYGDTSWKAYLFKTRPPQIITVVCGVLSIIIAAVVILSHVA
jgi:hypothetical protein